MTLREDRRNLAVLLWLPVAAGFLALPAAQAAPRSGKPVVDAAVRPALQKAGASARLLSISVDPPAIRLSDANGREQLLVTGKLSDGTEQDLTRDALYVPDGRLCAVT